MDSSAVPQLSVIVASVHFGEDLEGCVDTLVKQAQGKNVEIIVSDCSLNGALKDLQAKYPEVIFIPFPEKTTLPCLWGEGIARSRGQIITITESACIVDDNWIAEILKAHEFSHPVIGGAVETAKLNKWVDWAAYFCEYGQFMYPLKEGVVNELPGNNVSFKRWTLNQGREFIRNGFWKTYWCRKLQEEGIQLMSAPSILVYNKKSYRLMPFLIRRFRHGRCFAGMRVVQAALLTRICYALGSPLLPVIFLFRTINALWAKKRYRKEFLLSLPIAVLAIVMWSMGEFLGYVAGKGNSCSYIY
jgi:hypothetical protein